MKNLIGFHDQALKFIQSDAFCLKIGDSYSLDILALEFENFWRYKICLELFNWSSMKEQDYLQLSQNQWSELLEKISKKND